MVDNIGIASLWLGAFMLGTFGRMAGWKPWQSAALVLCLGLLMWGARGL